MFGFLFSLKQLVQKMAPRGASGGFHACSTSTYKLNYFESASGFRFILCTDFKAGGLGRAMTSPVSRVARLVLPLKMPLHRRRHARSAAAYLRRHFCGASHEESALGGRRAN